MTVKELVDLLLECPQFQNVVVSINGLDVTIKDCGANSLMTTIYVED